MKMKSIISALVTAAFILSVASLSIATDQKMEVSGTVTKIEGNKVTVKDNMGKEMTAYVTDVKNTKVGDKVKIEDGVIKSSTEESGTSEKPKKPGY